MIMAHVFGHSLIIRVSPKFMTQNLIQSILTFITDVILILILLYLIGRLSSYPLSFVFKTTHYDRLFYKLIWRICEILELHFCFLQLREWDISVSKRTQWFVHREAYVVERAFNHLLGLVVLLILVFILKVFYNCLLFSNFMRQQPYFVIQ